MCFRHAQQQIKGLPYGTDVCLVLSGDIKRSPMRRCLSAVECRVVLSVWCVECPAVRWAVRTPETSDHNPTERRSAGMGMQPPALCYII